MDGKLYKSFSLFFSSALAFFFFLRPVDGHGAVQTPEVKLISFAIWTIFYLGVLVVEWLVYAIVRHSKK